MSVYDNDSRVRVEPLVGGMWLVRPLGRAEVAVVEGDDGLWTAFEYEPCGRGVRLGDELNIDSGTFDTVVHALIGDPQ